MRHDGPDREDFAAYVAARWPTLVRALVLLGCPPAVAHEVTASALARCRSSWGRIRDGDPDDEVARVLLETWSDRRRTPWWEGLAPPVDAADVTSADPGRALGLDRLTPAVRQQLVLGVVAGVGVTGSGAPDGSGEAGVAAGDLRAAAESIRVDPAPSVEGLAAQGTGRPPYRPHAGVVLLVSAVVLVVAVATWRGTRPEPAVAPVDPDVLGAVTVTRTENPAAVAWYAEHTLHLEHVALSLPQDTVPTSLAELDGSAVYADDGGRLVLADDQGTRTVLGHQRSSDPVVTGQEDGWVVWVDPRGDVPELWVYDVVSRELLGRRALPADPGDATRAVAVDGGRVFWRDVAGVHEWDVSANTVAAVDDGLLDVASRNRVFQIDPVTIEMRQAFFDVTLDRPGRGAQLSDDGDYALTRPFDETRGESTIRVYDTRSGAAVSTGLDPGAYAVAAALGPDRTVSFIVLPGSGSGSGLGSGSAVLLGCDFGRGSGEAGDCTVLAAFAASGLTPLLAQ